MEGRVIKLEGEVRDHGVANHGYVVVCGGGKELEIDLRNKRNLKNGTPSWRCYQSYPWPKYLKTHIL